MYERISQQLSGLLNNIIAYLPSLFAGLILITVGLVLGWVGKRLMVRIAIILRLGRLFLRFRWGKAFSRGDVRFGFFNFLGGIVYLLIFMIFLNEALNAWKLTHLAALFERGILFFPRIFIALLIFGLGWIVAGWAEAAIKRVLLREQVFRGMLIGNFCKAVMIFIFFSMALYELNIAPNIVIIAFSAIMITLGALTIILAAKRRETALEKKKSDIFEHPREAS